MIFLVCLFEVAFGSSLFRRSLKTLLTSSSSKFSSPRRTTGDTSCRLFASRVFDDDVNAGLPAFRSSVPLISKVHVSCFVGLLVYSFIHTPAAVSKISLEF